MIGKSTDVGKSRPINEDSVWAGMYGNVTYAAVADGMGGHNAGEVASGDLINILRFEIENMPPLDTDYEIGRFIVNIVNDANRRIYEKSHSNPQYNGMGTTITIAFVKDMVLQVIHVGDSRAYIARGSELLRVTNDHSLVEELYMKGEITEAEAKTHPQRNMITRAVGCDPDIKIDRYRLKLNMDDKIFMCTDGLTNLVSDKEISDVIASSGLNYQSACDELIDLANRRGGTDNITAVLFDAAEHMRGDNL